MPEWRLAQETFAISREALFIDSSILVGAFLPEDQWHVDARVFLEDREDQVLVPTPVLVESWGMIVGSRRRFDQGIKMLQWLDGPAEALLIPGRTDVVGRSHDLSAKIHVDLVDALLCCMADACNRQLSLEPPLAVASFDTGHIARCMSKGRLRIRVHDPQTDDEYP